MKKKKLISLFLILLIVLSGYFFRYQIYEILPKNIQSIARIIISNKINTTRLDNDYNVKFLPETQFAYFNFKKINLNIEINKESGYGNFIKKKSVKTFYIDLLGDYIFITFSNGKIYKANLDELINDKVNLIKLETNISNLSVLDTLIHKDIFYLTASEKINANCYKFIYLKGKIIKNDLNFEKRVIDETCYKTIQSGRVQYLNKLNSLIISSGADILNLKNQSDPKPQNLDSFMGKILLVNPDDNSKTIFSSGHRNILGLVASDDYILATENGPKGGDEINLINYGKNYGWPISSYGEKYDSISNNEISYFKSHEEYGFEEPIYSFIPSIGVSEIIKLDDKFSKFWKNNFLIGSLNFRHLLRVKFDKNFSKVTYMEKIFIGERIRDLKYSVKKRVIILALEDTGSIGILSNN